MQGPNARKVKCGRVYSASGCKDTRLDRKHVDTIVFKN